MRQNSTNGTRAQQPTRQSLGGTQPDQLSLTVSYKDAEGDEVKLTRGVLSTLSLENFTNPEIYTYFQYCRYRRLNPLKKEVFLTKYDGKATVIIARDCYNNRANANAKYDGKESGIIVLNEQGVIEERQGTVYLKKDDREELLGAWCRVYMKNRKYPEYVSVNLDEAAKRKADGSLMATWKTQTAWMLVKVAEVRALRAALPEEFGGAYSADELGVEEPSNDMNTPYQDPKAAKREAVDVDYEPVADPATGEVTDEDEQGDIFG